MNSGAPLTSRTANQVYAGQVGPGRRRGGDGELAFGRLRQEGMADGAERDVRAPLTRRCDAAHGADHAPAGDEEPQVVSGRRHELLDQRALATEPAPLPQLLQQQAERVWVVAAVDLLAAASEAGLDDEREAEP